MVKLKRLNNINESYSEDDFNFKTELSFNEISIDFYDEDYNIDYYDYKAIIYWYIDFEFIGDSGIEYNIYSENIKLTIYYNILNDKGDLIEENLEKEIIINREDIDVDITSLNNNQIIPDNIYIKEYDKGKFAADLFF